MLALFKIKQPAGFRNPQAVLFSSIGYGLRSVCTITDTQSEQAVVSGFYK